METIVSIVEETPLKLLDVVEWVNSSPSSLGRPYRPRRGNQQIYLLSKLTTDKVKIFPLAVGKLSSYGVVTDISNRLDKAEKTNKLIRGKNVLVHSASNTERGLRHPAMFPLAIPEFFIKLFTVENDLVLDPFCGSGTTCRIAKRLNRKYLGFDTCERYCKTAEKTLRKIKRGDYIGKSNPNISKSSSVKG
jgi:DNA modification methylase